MSLPLAAAAFGLIIASVTAHLSVIYVLLMYLRRVRRRGLYSHGQALRLLLSVIVSIIVVHGIEVAM